MAKPEPASSGFPPVVDYTTVDDRGLVALAIEGRESAYREILTRFERPLFSLIYRMVRDRALSEDLAQEAFVKAFQALDRYDPRYKFSSWIFKIANNLTIDYLRKRRLDTVSIDGAPDATDSDRQAQTRLVVESGAESPEDYVQNRELGGLIEQAIGGLREEYRTAVLLRHVEGYPYEEIAEIMEVPLGTVKTYLHRARKELKTALGDVV